MKNELLYISGMTCNNCQKTIYKNLIGLNGVNKAKVSYETGTAEISYNEDIINIQQIKDSIIDIGYKAISKKEKTNEKLIVLLMIILISVLYFIVENSSIIKSIPEINQSMGYWALFVVGSLTSVHCVAMCGGLHLPHASNDNRKIAIANSILYNLGRVFAYGLVGGVVGLIGEVVALSTGSKALITILSAIFMLIMGLNMLDTFPILKKIKIRIPWYKAIRVKSRKSFVMGMLNALVPCGPLQTMQLYALGNGSFISGFFSMVVFGLGTIPLMLLIMITSSLTVKKHSKMIMKASAIIVVVMGVAALNRGINLSGYNIFADKSNGVQTKIVDGIQVVETKLQSGSYPNLEVKEDIPVKWILTATKETINGCNNEIIIPKYGIKKKLNVGDNIIEFTPTESGDISYTCWMGMIHGNIKVE